MLDDILEYIQRPFLVLSGTPVTALSLLTALAIVVAARIVGGFVARGAGRLLAARGADQGVQFAVAKILRYLVTIVGTLVAVSTIGVNMSAVLAASAVLLVGIGFGLQKVAENFISGLILLIERPVRKGDFVLVAGKLGTVEDIGMRATRILSRDGIMMIVPNGELVSSMVVNHSVPTTTQRLTIEVGVAYGSDLDRARAALLAVAAAEPQVMREPAPLVRLDRFGDSSLDLALVVWIPEAREDIVIASGLRFAIDAAFRDAGVAIPCPQRDVWIRTAPPAG
ncbi:MAG: mechanosensitive ion channel [Myxococcales bacterium]|nr:mechanosensitive ion channel [Myxococcales bacterium]